MDDALIKIGILMGGPSREREIAFAGGRTVYDNLDKSLFEPIPLFIDSHRRIIHLDWQNVYKGTIRDFYPPASVLPETEHAYQIYLESLGTLDDDAYDSLIREVGKPVALAELPGMIDVAFLSLHGEYGEDGQLQGLLESLGVPYTGSGIRACAIGMDKAFQKRMMEGDFPTPYVQVVERNDWAAMSKRKRTAFYQQCREYIDYPMVIRPANQGSSIGVAIIDEEGFRTFERTVEAAFFRMTLTREEWTALFLDERIDYVRRITDIRDGLGFPIAVGEVTIYHPEELLEFLNEYFEDGNNDDILLESYLTEQRVIVESFIEGREFSCIVLRKEDGKVSALPPTEIVKGGEVFDYRSKYLPGLSRKVTPIDLPDEQINDIRLECERLFKYFEFNTYARIDGFINAEGTIYLNDPNTTSGMLPSSFFFHQAAEIGLNPSQFLTYIIRTSLWERARTSVRLGTATDLMLRLDQRLQDLRNSPRERTRIAVFLGGYSFERHISVESGRNIYEKLASSDKYEPVPIFLTGREGDYELYQIPINLLLKDNADDIRDKILTYKQHPVVEAIKLECADLTRKYASRDVVFEPRQVTYEELADEVDGVFIALHGRPGEDGTVQQELEAIGLPYNGSSYDSSNVTINKYETLRRLAAEGFTVARQHLTHRTEYEADRDRTVAEIEGQFTYPFIAKPVDDGCSSAVLVIKSREQLLAYMSAIYRDDEALAPEHYQSLKLKHNEEFPLKDRILIEELITANGAKHFLEITGGLMTKYESADEVAYEVFEPSEALSGGEVLSLEEKFLAGEGQNITPARFAPTPDEYRRIADIVKADLQRAAELLDVKGYARIDAFVRVYPDGRVETIVIEVNSLPGMTPATCIFHQSAINGYKPYQFIDGILEFGFERMRRATTTVDG